MAAGGIAEAFSCVGLGAETKRPPVGPAKRNRRGSGGCACWSLQRDARPAAPVPRMGLCERRKDDVSDGKENLGMPYVPVAGALRACKGTVCPHEDEYKP